MTLSWRDSTAGKVALMSVSPLIDAASFSLPVILVVMVIAEMPFFEQLLVSVVNRGLRNVW